MTTRPPRRRPTARLLRAVVLCVLAVATVAAGLTAPSPARAQDTPRPVVLIGAAGLRWEDVTAEATPALWSLAQDGVGSLVVRSVRSYTCPADGWLAISTGTRAADVEGACRVLLEPRDDGAVPGWSDYVDAAAEENFDARPGLLGDVLAASGTTATAIGPGAAIAVADSTGQVADHRPRAIAGLELTTQVIAAVGSSDLVVIDAGTIRERGETYDAGSPVPEQHRADQVRVVERRVASILDGIEATGADPVVVLSGVADSGYSPGLRVLAVTDRSAQAPALLTSSSTRQTGYVLSTDQQPTLTSTLGISAAVPSGVPIGSPVVPEQHAGTAAERVALVRDQEVHAQAVRPLVSTYYLILVILNLALFASVAVGLKRPAADRISAFFTRRFPNVPGRTVLQGLVNHRDVVLRILRVVALFIGSLPVASFLTNLIPWWRNSPPALGLAVYTLGWALAVVLAARLGPWRHRVLGSAMFVAAVTAGVLTIDVLTGATLQISAVMGVPTLVAGRFYGMNNTTFALFTASTILVTVALTNGLVRRGRRRLAAAVVLVIGVVAAVIDGAPGIGADFGGPPALLPAFGVMALLAAGIRLTWRRAVAVLGAAALATLAFAFVDWLRPPDQRTHLGRFLQTVLDGGLWPVIVRKLDQNITILFGNRPLTILAICGVLTVVFVLARPIRMALTSPSGGEFDWLSAGTPLSRMGADAPMLPNGLVGLAIALGLGLAVNDSGIAIPAIGVSVAVPLLIASVSTWMLGLAAPLVPPPTSPAPDAEGERATA